MQHRGFTDLDDMRLIYRGNKILNNLFSKSVHSIRQLSEDGSSAKGFYRFLQNDRVIPNGIIMQTKIDLKKYNCMSKY